MKIVAGGHGRVALRVSRLVRKRGDRLRSLTRNPAHREDIESGGGEPADDGEISRDDVAAVLASCLDDTEPAGVTFEAMAGDEPLESALAPCRSLSATRGAAPA
jgi:hypothetical protein